MGIISNKSFVFGKALVELWEYRGLFWEFGITDLKVRYRGSILGFFWSFLEPLSMLVVLSLFFGYLSRSPIPYYTLFLLLGLIMWNMFTRGISMGSVVGRGGVIKDVYFPRVVLVLDGCITASLMASFELMIFIVLAAYYGVIPRIEWPAFPLVFVLAFLVIVGISMILSGINAVYRDVQYIWQVIVQAGFFYDPHFLLTLTTLLAFSC